MCYKYIHKIKIIKIEHNWKMYVTKNQEYNNDVTSMLNYVWKISVKLLKGNDTFFKQIDYPKNVHF